MRVRKRNPVQDGPTKAVVTVLGKKLPLSLVAFCISAVVHVAVFTTFSFIPFTAGRITHPKIQLPRGDSAIQVRILFDLVPEPVVNAEEESPTETVSDEDQRLPSTSPTNIVETEFSADVEEKPFFPLEQRPEVVVAPFEPPERLDEETSPTQVHSDRSIVSEATVDTGVEIVNTGPNTTSQSQRHELLPANEVQHHQTAQRKNPPTERKRNPLRPSSTPAATDEGVKTGAKVLNVPRPRYPLISRRLGEEGVVLLEVEVLPSGHSGRIKVLSDPGHPRLREAAMNAAKKAKFQPAMRNGKPVRDVVRIPFRFVLR